MVTRLARIPSPPVSHFVEELWLVRMRFDAPVRMSLLPDGGMAILINLGDPQRRFDGGGAVYRRSWVSGAQPSPIGLEICGCYEALGIGFRPGGAAPLFGFNLTELAGRVVELEDIWGADARRLREQLAELRPDAVRLARLEQWLARRYRDAEPERRIGFAAAQLVRRDVPVKVRAIAEALNLSPKHLVAEYTRHTGLTPKYFARVRRLQAAIARVGFAPWPDWAGVALACGYYDQAHLINEFKALTGTTPTGYLSRRSPFLGYLAAD